MMVPPLMMALGLSYISHRAIGRVDMRVLALCAATSALGIGSFALAPLPPIRSFALAGACGLALTWLAVITLVPRTPARRRRRLRLPGLKLAAFVRRRYGVKVMVATALILVTFPFLAAELRFASDPLNYFPPSDPAVQAFDVLDRKLTGMLPFQVTSPDPAARSLLEQTPGVRKVIDISAPPSGGARTYWCLADNAALPRLAAATPRWAEWARTRGTSIEWRGVAAQLHAAEQILRRLAIGSLLGMAAVATIAILLRTRRPVLATLTGLVTLVPIALLAGIMAALDIPVNLTSLMIGAISVGFAVDDVLHITCATLARGSVQRALVSCWRPCVGSSMINVACMACFALSPFRPTQQFGLLLASAAGLAMLSNQIVLPTLLSLLLSIGGRSRRAPRRAPVAADGPIQVPPELRPTDGSSASSQPGQGSCPPRLLWR
jgi:predicted RND superfamily exporter protein